MNLDDMTKTEIVGPKRSFLDKMTEESQKTGLNLYQYLERQHNQWEEADITIQELKLTANRLETELVAKRYCNREACTQGKETCCLCNR